MTTYVLLLRGINVGGKNKLPMAGLKLFLEELGCSNVTTYIQSGNVIVQSKVDAKALAEKVETGLSKKFKLDSAVIRVLVLTDRELQKMVDEKPRGFGEHPDKYHSDAIFLIGIDAQDALSVFKPREGVDQIWAGNGVIYSQRLSSQRTKSRLGKIVGTPFYPSMTIRSWNTTTKLIEILKGALYASR